MLEKYEMVFEKVMKEKGIKNWWDLLDSEEFDEVEKQCRELEEFNEELFNGWVEEISWEL